VCFYGLLKKLRRRRGMQVWLGTSPTTNATVPPTDVFLFSFHDRPGCNSGLLLVFFAASNQRKPKLQPMRKFILAAALLALFVLPACEKEKNNDVYGDGPRTTVSSDLQGPWMFGKFSMTEYWSTNPGSYLGNALEFAIAFQFNANGTYTHYFTAKSVLAGGITYHQSVTTGTMEVDAASKVIRLHAFKSHYRRTRNGQVEEDRDMTDAEVRGTTSYTYTTGVDASGTDALYLKMQNTREPLTFLKQ
jgi:hypothetical protein